MRWLCQILYRLYIYNTIGLSDKSEPFVWCYKTEAKINQWFIFTSNIIHHSTGSSAPPFSCSEYRVCVGRPSPPRPAVCRGPGGGEPPAGHHRGPGPVHGGHRRGRPAGLLRTSPGREPPGGLLPTGALISTQRDGATTPGPRPPQQQQHSYWPEIRNILLWFYWYKPFISTYYDSFQY